MEAGKGQMHPGRFRQSRALSIPGQLLWSVPPWEGPHSGSGDQKLGNRLPGLAVSTAALLLVVLYIELL